MEVTGEGGGAHNCTLNNCTVTGNNGGGAYGCILKNCTLSSNLGSYGGGGAAVSTLYNCTLTGNSANVGGGALECTLHNCTLTGNSAWWNGGGGGAVSSTLYNCTVTGNDGGGIGSGWYGREDSILYNSIIYYNFGGNYGEGTTLKYCCTTPPPTNGVGNITGHPLFMDMAAGDFRLREESPCIDAGTNLIGFSATATNQWGDVYGIAYTYEPTDMLGNTRFIDGNFDGIVAWDIGAYEFNSFPPPRFTCAPQRMPDCWRLSITGAPNKWVHVQKSSDLKNWEDFSWPPYILMGSEGVKQVDDYLGGGEEPQAMFYRAVVE